MAKILVERGLSVDRLREVLDYNPDTGVFTWKVKAGKNIVIGKEAGTLLEDGYTRIMISYVGHMAHRLAWAHYYGEWPKEQIDHSDGIRNDNRISSLRLATNKQNNENRKKLKNNTSGFLGVCFKKSTGRWVAYVRHDGKLLHLGYFDTPEEAAAVAKTKREELFSHYNGRDAA